MSDLTADMKRVVDRIEAAARATEFEIEIDYTNWRGERALRRIHTPKLVYRMNSYHPKRCYMIEAFDVVRGDLRTFPVSNIHSWREIDPSAADSAQS